MTKKQIHKIIQNITNQIIEKYKPEKIILYGSYVYGKPKKNSDIDLLVIKETKERFMKRLIHMAKIIKAPVDRDIIVYNPQEFQQAIALKNPFIVEVANKGKILYERI